MKHILFFALKEELLQVLESLESKEALQYVRMGNYRLDELSGGVSVVSRGAEIPNLGHATADSTAACDSYLVCAQDISINFRAVHGIGQDRRVCVDQLLNPDSVTFTPGGVFSDQIILHGRVATASPSKASQTLMKQFGSVFKSSFKRMKAFYVSPNALELLECGTRLTISAHSPREFDLATGSGAGDENAP